MAQGERGSIPLSLVPALPSGMRGCSQWSDGRGCPHERAVTGVAVPSGLSTPRRELSPGRPMCAAFYQACYALVAALPIVAVGLRHRLPPRLRSGGDGGYGHVPLRWVTGADGDLCPGSALGRPVCRPLGDYMAPAETTVLSRGADPCTGRRGT